MKLDYFWYGTSFSAQKLNVFTVGHSLFPLRFFVPLGLRDILEDQLVSFGPVYALHLLNYDLNVVKVNLCGILDCLVEFEAIG